MLGFELDTRIGNVLGLLITFALGLFILLGALITKISKDHHTVEEVSIAVAFGTMTTLALADLLPEAFEHLGDESGLLILLCAVIGIVALKLLDHFIPDHDDEVSLDHHCSDENVTHIGVITTIAVTLHNLIEGMAVYSVAATDLASGLVIALGVGLHNIPMGMIIYSTLVHEGRGQKVVLLGSAALSTFVGGLIMCVTWGSVSDYAVGILIALTLGMIAYIVLFELLPHLLHSRHKLAVVLEALVGVIIVLISVSLG